MRKLKIWLLDWIDIWLMWEVSSGTELVRLLARQAENSTSGWGSFLERSPLDSWYSTSAFRNVPGTVPEDVLICGFKRDSSNLDSAPKMRDSVQLKSCDSFFVTFPSISSETCAVYSSVIPGADGFCDLLFQANSCVSLEIAANFRVSLNVPSSGTGSTVVKTELACFF